MEFRPSGTVGKPVGTETELKPFTLEGKPTFVPGQKPVVLEVKDPRGGPVRAWSMSTLFQFEKCPHSVFLNKVQRVPQESGAAADRGSMIHALAEDYVQAKELPEGTDVDQDGFPTILKKFKTGIMSLKEKFAEGFVEIEGEWAFDIEWNITSWVSKDTWSRHKLDVLLNDSPTSAVIIDYKSGKKFGNELKHNQQGYDYAIAAFLRNKELEFIRTEFWYIDTGETMINSYTRAQAMALLPGIEKRATKLTSCTDFPPKPSNHNCKYCSYRGNACEWSE